MNDDKSAAFSRRDDNSSLLSQLPVLIGLQHFPLLSGDVLLQFFLLLGGLSGQHHPHLLIVEIGALIIIIASQ